MSVGTLYADPGWYSGPLEAEEPVLDLNFISVQYIEGLSLVYADFYGFIWV